MNKKELYDVINSLGMIDDNEYPESEFEEICESLPDTMMFVSDLFTNNDNSTVENLLVNLIYKAK